MTNHYQFGEEEQSIYEVKVDKIDRFINDVTRIVKTDRAKDYGDAKENFKRIADLWGIYLKQDIDIRDVAVLMILHKLSRLKANPSHRDSWIDIAGYATLAGTF